MNYSIVEKFSTKIVEDLDCPKADMKQYRKEMRGTLEGNTLNSNSQGCIAAVIQQELEESIQRELAKTNEYATRYKELANEPHKLLVKIVEDLNKEIFEKILDQIGSILNTAYGKEIITKKNGIRTATKDCPNKDAMLNKNGRRRESAYMAEAQIIDWGKDLNRINEQDSERWKILAKIDGGITTGLKESVQTVKFILEDFGGVSKANLDNLIRSIKENGLSFIKKLSHQPSDPGAKFIEFITKLNSPGQPAHSLTEMITNTSFDKKILSLTDKSIGIREDKLNQFIKSYPQIIAKEIKTAEAVVKDKRQVIKKLAPEVTKLEQEINKSDEERLSDCREIIKTIPENYQQLKKQGLLEIAAKQLANKSLEIIRHKHIESKSILKFAKLELSQAQDYIERNQDKTLYKCPAAYSTVAATKDDGSVKRISTIEAFYKLVADRFTKTLELAYQSK